MTEALLWIAGGGTALAVAGLLIGFTAWLRFLDGDAERCRDGTKSTRRFGWEHRCYQHGQE